MMTPLPQTALPPGVRSRFIDDVNGLRVHVLEAGFEAAGRPCVVLLHGFPELAYAWRKVMRPLAEAGFHVLAPDQRGYGRTTGWSADYDAELAPFRMLNLTVDVMTLVRACGHREVHAVVGRDFGASVAAWCALARPDLFRSVCLMTAPFAGTPELPLGRAEPERDIQADLAALPRPRKHYQWYYSTRAANADMWRCTQGVHDFLRAYYHHKSADWPGNRPFPLLSWSAGELAKMPTYYIMDGDRTMAETVAAEMPAPAQIAACRWLTEDELRVYSVEYERTGFQGGLAWYRCQTGGLSARDMRLFAGCTIDVPSLFIAGRQDWGVRQTPGAFERMQARACTDMRGCHLIEGAGHWVEQEQAEQVAGLLAAFLQEER